MYIDGTKPNLTGVGATMLSIIPGAGGTGTQDATITSPTGATMTGNINADSRFLVAQDTTQRFTITSVVTPTVAGGLYSVALNSIAYDTQDQSGTLHYTSNLSSYVTPSVNLNI